MPDDADAALLKLKRASAFIKGPSGTGTGYLLAPQRIGTALHVVKDWAAEECYPVVLGNGPTVNARLLAQDPATDAAVLEFKEVVDIEPLPVADSL
jgi:S1-C subfamily serine protease